MAFKLAEAFVEFKQRGLTGVQRGITGIGASMRSVAGLATGLHAKLLTLGVGVTFAASIRAAGEQIKAEKKLEAVLKATGHAAGKTSEEIRKLASERQGLTNFGDEATIAAAGMLATFKEIKGDVFDGALIAAQDLSAVMDQDLNSSIVQIGKALNDPIRGVTALQRVGVAFTKSQKDQIKAMVEAGDLMGAQKIILGELESEFGGAAARMADPFIQFGNMFGDVMENVGFALRPIAREVTEFFTKILGPVSDGRDALTAWGESIATDLVPFLENASDVLDGIGRAVGRVADKWNEWYTDIFGGSSLIKDLGDRFAFIGRNWEDMLELIVLQTENAVDRMANFFMTLPAKLEGLKPEIRKALGLPELPDAIKEALGQPTGKRMDQSGVKNYEETLIREPAGPKQGGPAVPAFMEQESPFAKRQKANEAEQQEVLDRIGAREVKRQQDRTKPKADEEEKKATAGGAIPKAVADEEKKKEKEKEKEKAPAILAFDALSAKVQTAGNNPIVKAQQEGNSILSDILDAVSGTVADAKSITADGALKSIFKASDALEGFINKDGLERRRQEKRDKISDAIKAAGGGAFGAGQIAALMAPKREPVIPMQKTQEEIAAEFQRQQTRDLVASRIKEKGGGAMGAAEIQQIVKQLKSTHDLLAKKGIKTDTTAVLGK